MNNESMNNEQVYMAALAGLLHDIGRFAQRRGEPEGHAAVGTGLLKETGPLGHLIPLAWQADVGDAVADRGKRAMHKPVVQVVQVASRLAMSDRITGQHERGTPAETPLIPIVAQVSLSDPPADEGWGYPLGEAVDEFVVFPQQNVQVSLADYDNLWKARFLSRVKTFSGPVNSFSRMAGLMALLADTTIYIPSATPWERDPEERAIPNVPLYNHLHLTAAISVCLMSLPLDDLGTLYQAGDKVREQDIIVAHLLKVDFSGIQDFIYRIAEPADERTFRHAAKRLRGRSLHLALLNRIIGDWLARRLELPPTNILLTGGGVLELLLPPAPSTKRLDAALGEMETAMWKAFGGNLGAVWATIPMQPADFAGVRQRRIELEEKIAQAKSHKWHTRLQEPDFFQSRETYHTCPVCRLTSVNNEGNICHLCALHEQIGATLPHVEALLHVTEQPPQESGVTLALPAPMRGYVTLSRSQEVKSTLEWVEQEAHSVLVEGVNTFPKVSGSWPRKGAPGAWTAANAAPIVGGNVLDFEQIADLSRGTPLLGVLRGDADLMGLNFSHGLRHPTFARTIALSQTVARFFGPYLNELAVTLTDEWRGGLEDDFCKTLERRGLNTQVIKDLSNLFYILYAGGDDLFVIGPWDQMIAFALRLGAAFQEYTCGKLTLSAGLVLVKPHFPIHQFARLAGEAEHEAKDAGRNRFHIFDISLPWNRAERLIEVGKGWVQQIETGKMPRSLIHDLGREAQKRDGIFTPTLYYTLARRLRGWKSEQRQTFAQEVLDVLPDIVVPVSYASLITRKE